MDIRINDNAPSTNTCNNERSCVSSSLVVDCDNMNSNDYLLEIHDRSTLISDFVIKKQKCCCQCSPSGKYKTSSQPWITFIHIICTVRAHLGNLF